MSDTINTIVNARKEAFVTRLLIATALFSERFYAGKDNDWGKVTSEVAKNAEAQINGKDFDGDVSTFKATIKALTGEDIQFRQPAVVTYQVGVCVVPVAPIYGERAKDGYELGTPYVCVNETSGGKFRNAATAAARMTSGSHNMVGLMSRLSDEVRPATEEEIRKLADELLAIKGLTLMHDLEPELSRYDAFLSK